MSFIDRHIAPKIDKEHLARLIALWHRCPECDHLDVSDLIVPGKARNVNALLDDSQYEHLRKVAFETRRSMTDILREALTKWLDAYEPVQEQDPTTL